LWYKSKIMENLKEGLIYMYISPSGKKYIGQTTNEENRKNQHKYKTSLTNTKFGIALRKYSYINFTYKVLIKFNATLNLIKLKRVLDKLEFRYIKLYDTFNNGYNQTNGGEGVLGYTHSKEVLEKMNPQSKEIEQQIAIPDSVLNFKQDGRTTRKEYNDLNVYAQIKKFMNSQTKMSIVSIARLAQDCEMSNQGVVNAIKRLEECGDIVKTKVGKCNAYKFNTKSEKFEMYDYEFLKNKDLTTQQKAFMIAVQKHLYVDKDTGVAKTTYTDKELSEKTGISESTIYRRVSELVDNQFISKRLTSNNEGNPVEALEFNLPKFGQFVLCKIEQHDIIIAQQQMQINKMQYELDMVKKYLKATAIDLATMDDQEIEM